MEIVKKNILNILCGVVALLGLIALLWPVSSMAHSLKQEMETRQQKMQSFESLASQSFTIPSVILPKDQTDPDLGTFPSEQTTQSAYEALKAYSQYSNEIYSKAVERSRDSHEYLNYGAALPSSGPTEEFTFVVAYNQAISSGYPDVITGIPAQLHATVIPNKSDIEKAVAEVTRRIEAAATAANQTLENNVWKTELAKSVAETQKNFATIRAEEYGIYVQPGALSIAEGMQQSATPPSIEQVWNAQVSLWVQQDVANVIAQMNGADDATTRPTTRGFSLPAHNILVNPIKRINSLALQPGYGMYAMAAPPSSASAQPGGLPVSPMPSMGTPSIGAAGKADFTKPLPVDFNSSGTGHVCNDMYDVVTFTLDVDLQADQVETFLHELEKNKLINVRTIEHVQSLDLLELATQNYIFGSKPCVNLVITGEELFMRQWTIAKMPQAVKTHLGVLDMPAPATESGAQP